ncbi:hypothetical protein SO802_010575 [Lithocarpus litseifolius]|uniref:Uncharacterized protein n=1 Tax=Lithocarpus litseifolius TaxID=425828 RepID=A0AAW2DH87_9ROSI
MYDLPPGSMEKPMFEDAMNYVIECDVFGDPNAWIKVFQETHMVRLYFCTKLKKRNQKGKRIERSTHCGTWRCQKMKSVLLT